MKNLILALLVFTSGIVFGQDKINITLKKQLDSIMILETRRHDLHPLIDPLKRDTTVQGYSANDQVLYAKIWKEQDRIDSLNVVFVDSIFKIYGYPGKTLVGPGTIEVAWYVIQHANDKFKYMPVIKKAAENGELFYKYYAMMVDQQLVSQKKEQIYGTQAVCSKPHGSQEYVCFIWPIKDAETVNERRKKAGLESTVEENAKVMHITYKVLKLADIQ
ncbi:DUF6624 domain-containing protein [uncultured Mucilaginibacter sp.]|uniref:DUF6624 domain-containing protein n=1 Tax=uncultured Mucilaginibacter sp. TaxID=797541 RepID=UPI0025EE612A|nr:DUF6624 domain-containing protein [uncultured Mucilaginibacter sp.]